MKTALYNQNFLRPSPFRSTTYSETPYFGKGLDSFKRSKSRDTASQDKARPQKPAKNKRHTFYRSLLVPLLWISGIGGAGFLEFQGIKYLDCRDNGATVLEEKNSNSDLVQTPERKALFDSLKTVYTFEDTDRHLSFDIVSPDDSDNDLLNPTKYDQQIKTFQDAYDLNISAHPAFREGMVRLGNPIDIVIIDGVESFDLIGLNEKEVAASFSFQHNKHMCQQPYIITLTNSLSPTVADHELIHFMDSFRSDFSWDNAFSRDPIDRYVFLTILEKKDGFLPNMTQEEKDELTALYNTVVAKMETADPDSPVIEDQGEFLAYTLSSYRSGSLTDLTQYPNSKSFPLEEMETIRDFYDRYFETRNVNNTVNTNSE